MHAAALHLVPILAEKSKTPFYIAGGALVVWALSISLGVGMRNPSFPANLGQQRLVMAVTVVLVLFAVSMAVATAGGEKKAEARPAPVTGASTSTAAPATESTTSSQPTATTGAPTATTGAPAAGSSTTLKLAAAPGGELAYDTKSLSAKAGSVTIAFTNASPVEHDVTIAQGSNVVGATPKFIGATKSLTLNLKPGTYTFYCSVPGHRQAGMEGTLTVS
jgi:plastocyanin